MLSRMFAYIYVPYLCGARTHSMDMLLLFLVSSLSSVLRTHDWRHGRIRCQWLARIQTPKRAKQQQQQRRRRRKNGQQINYAHDCVQCCLRFVRIGLCCSIERLSVVKLIIILVINTIYINIYRHSYARTWKLSSKEQ